MLTREDTRSMVCARRWLPRVYRGLPDCLRCAGPFREATLRLRGRTPGLLTGALNRFWIGQTELPFRGMEPRGDSIQGATPKML